MNKYFETYEKETENLRLKIAVDSVAIDSVKTHKGKILDKDDGRMLNMEFDAGEKFTEYKIKYFISLSLHNKILLDNVEFNHDEILTFTSAIIKMTQNTGFM